MHRVMLWAVTNLVDTAAEVLFYRVPGLRELPSDTARYAAVGCRWAGRALLVSTLVSALLSSMTVPRALFVAIWTAVVTALVGAILAWWRDRTAG